MPAATASSAFALVSAGLGVVLVLGAGVLGVSHRYNGGVGADPGVVAEPARPPGIPTDSIQPIPVASAEPPVDEGTPPLSTTVPPDGQPKSHVGGLSGLSGLRGLAPSAGPGREGPSGTVSGTGQLDPTQIQSTVSRYTGSVRRACWQPAVDHREPGAPPSAKVNVRITVSPSGSVQSTDSGDPKGYPGLASCITSRVRGWQFPSARDTTIVNVPFVFAPQGGSTTQAF